MAFDFCFKILNVRKDHVHFVTTFPFIRKFHQPSVCTNYPQQIYSNISDCYRDDFDKQNLNLQSGGALPVPQGTRSTLTEQLSDKLKDQFCKLTTAIRLIEKSNRRDFRSQEDEFLRVSSGRWRQYRDRLELLIGGRMFVQIPLLSLYEV